LEHFTEPIIDFRGVARLFPLPNLVLFPQAVAPLHVFEPRYRALVEDALAGDRLIAMALLLPGWENDYEGRPPVASVICLGRILSQAKLPDGRFNLLLAGVQRAVIRRELPPTQLFREAEVDLLEDEYPSAGLENRVRLREELLQRVGQQLTSGSNCRRVSGCWLLRNSRPSKQLTPRLQIGLTPAQAGSNRTCNQQAVNRFRCVLPHQAIWVAISRSSRN